MRINKEQAGVLPAVMPDKCSRVTIVATLELLRRKRCQLSLYMNNINAHNKLLSRMIFRPLCATVIIAFLINISASVVVAQVKIGFDHSSADAAAMLEVASPATMPKGFLPPRVALSNTATWGLNGSAVSGMIVYNTNASLGSDGVGLYVWVTNRWAKLTVDAGITGSQSDNLRSRSYGYSMLSAAQVVNGSNAIINISAVPSPYNTVAYTSDNKVILQAGKTYRLRAGGLLDANSTSGGYAYIQWRKVSNSNPVGSKALLLAADYNGSFSGGGDASAVVTIGASDETYELVAVTASTASISALGFYTEVQEIKASTALSSPYKPPFSYKEQFTGKKWVDGKDVFEKTFFLNTTTSNGTVPVTAANFLNTPSTSFAHGISNFGTAVEITGVINFNAGSWFIFPAAYTNSEVTASVDATNIKSLRPSAGSDWTSNTYMYLTLRYTKTQ